MKILFFVLLILLSINGCYVNNSYQEKNNIFGRISVFGHRIVFNYFKNDVGSIYLYNSNSNICYRLTNPILGTDFNPSFSTDGNFVVYLNRSFNSNFLNVCRLNILTGQNDTLLKNLPNISEVCLSNDNKYLYYTKYTEIRNYSIIASPGPHGYKVFRYDLKSEIHHEVSNGVEYQIQGLTITDTDTLIALNIFSPFKNGFGVMNTNTGILKGFDIKNSPDSAVRFYYSPISVKKDSILFESIWNIFIYNFKTDDIRLIKHFTPDYKYNDSKVDSNWENIYYVHRDLGIIKFNIKTQIEENYNIIVPQ